MAYIPDHEPALGAQSFPGEPQWTSGFDLAEGVDLLIHDTQYDARQYQRRVGWGHSAVTHALRFAAQTGVKRLVTFHHDPGHDDATLDRILGDARGSDELPFEIIAGTEGARFDLSAPDGARRAR
jgi:ribonuclease BN (tRNA processing enzyme)